MTGCDRPFRRQRLFSVISGLRCGVGVWGELITQQATTSETAVSGNWNSGHRLPAWLRPGTKWPPGKNWLPLPHLVLGRLGEGHVVSCDGIHPLVSAAWPSVPTGARSDPRNQRRRYRRLPPSPVLLTSRLVGGRTRPAPGLTSHLEYSALSQALLTLRDRFLSGRRSEAVGHGTMVGRSFRFFGTIIPEGRRAAPLLFRPSASGVRRD